MKSSLLLSIASAAGVMFAVGSCSVDKEQVDYSKFYANALVTVKTISDGGFYLQLDDNTTARAVNITKSPFGEKQVRALCNITEVEPSLEVNGDIDNSVINKWVKINWIDSIRTKGIVPSQGDLDYVKYGSDPIDIVGNWVTIVEDGYLTLSFRVQWGNASKAHAVNLVSGTDPENPYVLVLRHNAFDDMYTAPGAAVVDGVVAFDLSSLPSTGGKDVDLIIKYRSGYFGGEHTARFKYCTGEASESGSQPSLESIDRHLNID